MLTIRSEEGGALGLSFPLSKEASQLKPVEVPNDIPLIDVTYDLTDWIRKKKPLLCRAEFSLLLLFAKARPG